MARRVATRSARPGRGAGPTTVDTGTGRAYAADRRCLRDARVASFVWASLFASTLLVACGDDSEGAQGAPQGVARVELEGSTKLLPGFSYDTGLQPEGASVAASFAVTARGEAKLTDRRHDVELQRRGRRDDDEQQQQRRRRRARRPLRGRLPPDRWRERRIRRRDRKLRAAHLRRGLHRPRPDRLRPPRRRHIHRHLRLRTGRRYVPGRRPLRRRRLRGGRQSARFSESFEPDCYWSTSVHDDARWNATFIGPVESLGDGPYVNFAMDVQYL